MLDLSQHPAERAALDQVGLGLTDLWLSAFQCGAVADAINVVTERMVGRVEPADIDAINGLAGAVAAVARLAQQRADELQKHLAACVRA